MNQLAPHTASALLAIVTAAGERAGMRFLELFAAEIRNPNTRRAYSQAVGAFLAWCEAEAGIRSLTAVQPLHVVSGAGYARIAGAADTWCFPSLG